MPENTNANSIGNPGASPREGQGIQASAPPPRNPGAPSRRTTRRRGTGGWVLFAVIGAVVLAVFLVWGVPYIRAYFTTVSTDDAYVNSHVTFVAPRIEDNVTEVYVDNGYFVEAALCWLGWTPSPTR